MGDMALQERTYQRAADIADVLLRHGLPVIGFGAGDGGAKVRMAFQLDDERAKYAVQLPVDEASVERFRELYEAVR